MNNEELDNPMRKIPRAFTGDLKVDKPMKVAAGVEAVFHAAQHVFGEMGVKRGLAAIANAESERWL